MQCAGPSRIVNRHFRFLNAIGRRLREEPYSTTIGRKAPLMERFAGLRQLFDSLASASVTARKVSERHIEEWNPFSQRVVLADHQPPHASALERDFTEITSYTQTFVEWSHEAVHVLALEPFFCGRRPIGTQEAFVTWKLANEALAFWYADMVLTPAIRDYVPGAEFVYNRSAVSNAAFHPEEAFRRAGVTDAHGVLSLYVDAFLGGKIMLDVRANAYFRVLGNQLGEFYSTGGRNLANWYRVLREIGLFDGYYERFCAIDGLPSLWSRRRTDEVARLPVGQYALRVGLECMPALTQCTARRIALVRVRRHLQTRAYFAWTILHAVRNERIVCVDSFDCAAIGAELDYYLAQLEDALHALARRAALGDIVRQLRAADRLYERRIRAAMNDAGAHARYRYHLFPFFAPTDALIGLADDRSAFTKKEMMAIVRFVMQRFDWNEGGGRSDLVGVVELLNGFLLRANARGGSALRDAYNRFMSHPQVLRHWSVAIGDVSPESNRFREIAFVYT